MEPTNISLVQDAKQNYVSEILKFANQKYRNQLQKALINLQAKPKKEEIQQFKENVFNQQEELLQILKEVEIQEVQEVQNCCKLYYGNQLKQLIELSQAKLQKKFAENIFRLVAKRQVKKKPSQNQTNVQKELRTILKNAGIEGQEIVRCIQLFKSTSIQLKQQPSKIHFQTFQKAQKTLPQIHYIFAIDQSGSMSGSPWLQLHASLTEAVQKIKAKDQNQDKHKISIIKFSDTANLCCENLTAQLVNLKMPFIGGGTNFDAPFNIAADLAEKYITSSSVVFIFMTDGGASYPAKGVAAMKKLRSIYPNKFKYAGIQFNCSTAVSKVIAQELNGTSGTAHNSEQLTELFKRSVQVSLY